MRKVSTDEGLQLGFTFSIKYSAKKYNMQFLESSAKDDNNIDSAFTSITREIIKNSSQAGYFCYFNIRSF